MSYSADLDINFMGLGWQVHSDDCMAVKASGVRYLELYGSYWVDRWVIDAIKQYNMYEGYGGLPLHEFLSKMNCDQTD